MVGWLISWLVS